MRIDGEVHGNVIAANGESYNRDIRPILAENCFACHGPDSAARKAELRLDRREAAVEMEAIVPGKPDDSELVRRIGSADPEKMMPPPATRKKLTDAQKEKLLAGIPAGRMGDVGEIAAAVAFLCSPDAAYINGVNLPVDGGRTRSL